MTRMAPELIEISHSTEVVNDRLAVTADDAARVLAIARGDVAPDSDFGRRVASRLVENRSLLTIHATSIADAIARLPLAQQPEQVAQLLRPVTLGVEQATIALARLRAAGGFS